MTRSVGVAMTLDAESVSLRAQMPFGGVVRTSSASFAYGYDEDLALTSTRLTARAFGNRRDPVLVSYARSLPAPTPTFTALTITSGTTTTTVASTRLGELAHLTTTTAGGMAEYEDEICARDGTGRITYRLEHVRRTGLSSGIEVLGYHYDYTDARLNRARRYALTSTTSCAGFMSSESSLRPTDDTRAIVYTTNGGVERGSSERCRQYDDADRPTCGGREYDTRGQLMRRGADRFSYDVQGRLRTSRTNGNTTTYDWDPAGRLVGMTDRTNDEHFVYGEGLGPIAWRRNGNTAFFAYGSQPHVPDVMWVDNGSDGTIDERYRIVTDERGSVRVVVRLDGDNTGRAVQRIDYDVFGVPSPTSLSGFSRVQPFGFAGGIYLPGPGLYRFGARDYDPTIAGWTGGDPIGIAGGENLYAYCGGDPVNRIDPEGDESFWVAVLEIIENVGIRRVETSPMTLQEAARAVEAGTDLGVSGQRALARDIARAAGGGEPVLERHALRQTIAERATGAATRFGQWHYHPTNASGERLSGMGHVLFSFGLTVTVGASCGGGAPAGHGWAEGLDAVGEDIAAIIDLFGPVAFLPPPGPVT